MDAIDRIQLLFARYRDKTIGPAELEELLAWMDGMDEQQLGQLAEADKHLWTQARAGKLSSTSHLVNWDTMLRKVMEPKVIPVEKSIVRKIWQRVAVAVAIVLFITASITVFLNSKDNFDTVVKKTPVLRLAENVLPNVNQTILSVEGGSQIVLDSIVKGNILLDKGIMVTKMQAGEIAYSVEDVRNKPEYHTISVPRGGRPYQVLLSDGSKIWLNAESSLRYPSFFSGSSRTVELTGEGYFEISQSFTDEGMKRPFFVNSDNVQIEVMGTRFNVMAYDDENFIETTLLEGSVRVTKNNRNVLLTPGKQAHLSRSGSINIVDCNTELATAWVNGYFQFQKADVKTILRQVGRWYDLDIEYKGAIPNDIFSGKIERHLPLTGIIKLLSSSNIKIQVEGKKLVVL